MKKTQKTNKPPKRANGMGCLFRRGNMWWGRVMRKGVLSVRSLGCHVHEEGKSDRELRAAAEARLLSMTAPMRLGSEIDALLFLKAKIESLSAARRNAASLSSSQKALKLKDAGAAFRAAREKAGKDGSTTNIFLANLAEFVEWAGGERAMPDVTQELAEMYAKSLEKRNLAPYTYNRKVTALRLVWKTLGMADVNGMGNPWDGIPAKKQDTVVRDTLTDDEIARIKSAAGEKYGGDLRMLVVIGEFTGLRLSDAATLKWDEIDFGTGIVTKKTGKTGSVIHAPILPEFKKELEAHRTRTGEWDNARLKGMTLAETLTEKMPDGFGAYVVPRMAAKAVRKDGASAIVMALRKAFAAAKVDTAVAVEGSKRKRPLKGFHSLRATWVTRCQAAGVPVSVIMATVGHASAHMTQHYTHLKEKEVLEAFRKAGVIGQGE